MGELAFPFSHRSLGRVASGPGLAHAPRVAHAAVRVPDPRQSDLTVEFPSGHPQIFVHEGARQALERRLSLAHRHPVLLSVTDNRRQMISHTQQSGILQARIHHMFLDAPGVVQEALVRYVVKGERAASLLVSKYINDNGYRIRAIQPVNTPLVTQGETHDLLPLFHKLNAKYFNNSVDALVTWGRATRASRSKPRRTIKLGTYSAVQRLIRIHPVLDRPWVPRYFVSSIVYHEMLHHLIPGSCTGKRRLSHPPLFHARERLFRDHERSVAWEKAHIHRLLRS